MSRKDLAATLADRLGAASGPRYWRTLEELCDSEAFRELMCQEFPEQADVWPDALSRRQFLTLMGASLALAGLGGCSMKPAPRGQIVPYVRAPEEVVPGKPLFFATAMALGGAAVGLLVESHEGRPTKVEGNPDHPASLGATDLFHQASVLTLYDPDRSPTVTLRHQTSTWDAALGELPVGGTPSVGGALRGQQARGGAGLRILTETVVSPTLNAQLQGLLKAFPNARWHAYEPVGRDAAFRAARAAFGEPVNALYDFRRADVVLSLDADFLSCGPGSLRYVADFTARRRVGTEAGDAANARMNRLYVVEPGVSPTGAKADHRLAVRAQEVEGLARTVAARLGVLSGDAAPSGPYDAWAAAVARDLEAHRGRSIVVAGDRQPAAVHLLAHALNHRLGNAGQTVLHTDRVDFGPDDQLQSLRELAEDMDRGQVEVLVILGGNPVYTAPADLAFAERMQRVPLRVRFGLFADETSRYCHWHLPEAHFLEAWGDARAYDGTASIVQPLITPLYQGRSAHELLSAFTSPVPLPGYEIVRGYWRDHWQSRGEGGDFETFWQTAVHDGVVAGTRLPPRTVALRGGWREALGAAPAGGAGPYELVFEPDPTVYDGRFANNGWLQELPKPVSSLTWDNAALMSPATARELGVWFGGYAHGGEHGGFHMPVVELRVGDRAVEAPVSIVPGHADGSVTVALGYGREYAGRVGGAPGRPVGFDAYRLRTADRPWFAGGLAVRKTGRTHLLACTQQHQLMENREVVRAATLEEYRHRPDFAADPDREREAEQTRRARRPLALYEPPPRPHYQWGMVIDLTACTGCKACVVACQAENNVPVVGKDQVARGREMHWLRVDRYTRGSYDAPEEFYFQPVPCMHCELAPCEYVCPTAATVHSADGLNDMIYQRCVGTRFCSNNCPYKVRRFNFLFYADYATPSRRLQYNPDVTVRSRGVMEKCTYCVQRIRHADVTAQGEGRRVIDGEVLTACQAACPADAIVFGDLGDPASKVRKCRDSSLNYALLGELNTRPRTTYLAALRNPNPELEGGAA
jgi:molybdopterin-containing oxidoreductase family iron-sulfur binding subunit